MGEKIKVGTNKKGWKGVDWITVLSALILGVVICRSSMLPSYVLFDQIIADGADIGFYFLSASGSGLPAGCNADV